MVSERDHRPGASDAQLIEALQRGLSEYLGKPAHITRLDRRRSQYSSSFTIEELDVELFGGDVLPLLFKDLSRRSLLDEARRVKPAFMLDPGREIEVYRTVLARNSFGTARCYGSVIDRKRERFWLFLERVHGVELYQVGEFGTWLEVARWLARFHNSCAAEAENLAAGIGLIRHDRDFYLTWLQRACRNLRSRRRASVREVEQLAAGYRIAMDRLLQLPPTLLHGEFFPSNVMVQKEKGGTRICVVDWETAAAGPGIIDLAALVSGGWRDREKTGLIKEYLNALSPGQETTADNSRFLEDVACGQLYLAMQWLGWSEDWSPPEEHRQDWLGIALDLACRLG